MYLKLMIKSELQVLTGMHIGGAGGYSSIGAVDSSVVRDPKTNMPIIPGSSLKGKLRALLVKNAYGGISQMKEKYKGDPDNIKRLFGSSDPIKASRLQFSDAFLINKEEFNEIGITEVKFENAIDRVSAVSNPRQIERVNAGAKFGIAIVYDADEEGEMLEDLENLALAMKLLQLDYLGGHGTRGSGRVSFENIELSVVFPENSDYALDGLRETFKKVEKYELLSL
ncbi:MAG: type III-A CRISPR-associated RAMP protein Csm3 [Clostridia bacterium]|nr:type III-A CRISPR-associated RAMP protein Csm3 [Clostridia bacterium]